MLDEFADSSRGLNFLTYVRNAETDLDGRFHFHFDPGEQVKLTVQANGFEPVTRSLMVAPDQGPIDFRLDSGKVIRGRVTDLDGRPILGANIIIPRFTRHEGVFLRTWTDSNGRFVWGSAPSGQVELSIWKEGYLGIDRATFTSDDRESAVVLRPGLTVTLRVRDSGSGQAIKQFTVEAGVVDPATGTVSWKPAVGAMDDGEYRTILDSSSAPYQIRVKAQGYEADISRVLKGNERDVEEVIDLKRTVGH